MKWVYHDGGRKAAGYTGDAGDCVTRAVAIIAELPYQEVYDRLAEGNATQRVTRKSRKLSGRRTAAHGISTRRKWFNDYITALGFTWVPTMGIGTGCRVHLTDGELPDGRLIVNVSKHVTAVIDGVIYDTYDPQREPSALFGADGNVARWTGGRCVYGYWRRG